MFARFAKYCLLDLSWWLATVDWFSWRYRRDKSDLECDAVIHLRNGHYGLIEIKLGGDLAIEAGATTLKKLNDKIDTTKMKQPSFLMVLTAVGRFAYRRDDGVYVVPVGCLKNWFSMNVYLLRHRYRWEWTPLRAEGGEGASLVCLCTKKKIST